MLLVVVGVVVVVVVVGGGGGDVVTLHEARLASSSQCAAFAWRGDTVPAFPFFPDMKRPAAAMKRPAAAKKPATNLMRTVRCRG